MKKLIRIIGFLLSLVLVLVSPVYAEEASMYSSAYFGSFDSSIRNTSGRTLEIWFDVVSNGIMEELGVSSIELEFCPNGGNWTKARTFLPEDYPQMVCKNTGITYDCVTHTGLYDFSYRAYVTFYAKNSRGEGYISRYSETVYIPRP